MRVAHVLTLLCVGVSASAVSVAPYVASAASSVPSAGQACPTWVHDRYVTKAPDGKTYPTWHQAIDPRSGCYFGHEHGADPRRSGANSTLPAFGYAAAQMGMTEPHEGFKVFVLNAGQTSDNGSTITADYRLVFHMGTSGTGRYSQQFHSLQYDYVARDGTGRYARVNGMADTGPTALDGSTCSTPRQGAKDFSTLDCPDTYEIWNNIHFQIIHPDDPYTDFMHTRLTVTASTAVFDPVLTRDPTDNSRLVYTQAVKGDPSVDPLSTAAWFRGCQREAYGGPNYWNNAGQPTVYYTDPLGRVQSGPGPGVIKQQVSALNSTRNEAFKLRQDFCGDGVHAPN
jgi:hypothetical protein